MAENNILHKLKYHFMSPYEKYMKYGRKPWKLVIQVLKIFMVTAQVILFGTDRFASIAFMKNTKNAFENLFIQSYDGTTPFFVINKNTLINAIKYTNETYYNLMEIPIGKFRYAGFAENNPLPILICLKQYKYANGNMSRGIDQDAATTEDCIEMFSESFLRFKLQQNGFFDSVVSIHLKFSLSVVFWNGLKRHHVPECFEMQNNDIRFYNICSVLLGLGVVLAWIGMLRFFTYLKSFNILLIALRYAAPSLIRFMFCAIFIFTGFTLCGWIVMAPYHLKFQTFLSTAEGLFSLLNGDDIYATFLNMSPMNTSVWVFSKIYLYTFISLFIYIVLSTFINIVGDTYEKLKEWGPTRIEDFMRGCLTSEASNEGFAPTCRCIREYIMKESLETLSSRRLSVISASFE
ncbi:mucolipin-2 isoform X4 [Hydra vulgaris]|uniref:Mucolipin-2 isoform X4 n=1 Tax=Hydra vulgaris TaxID=6087 RepID=A0ABM4DII8_HYDVU